MCMRFPVLCVTAAHQRVAHYPASAALQAVAVVEASAAAELAEFPGVRNHPAAAVSQPHRDPALRVVGTAVFIWKDKDRWRNHYQTMATDTSPAEKCHVELTGFHMEEVSSAALVIQTSWEQLPVAADRLGGTTETPVSSLAAVIMWFLCVQ